VWTGAAPPRQEARRGRGGGRLRLLDPTKQPAEAPPSLGLYQFSFAVQYSLVIDDRPSPRRLPSVERLVLRSSFTEASVDGKRRVLRGTASDGRVQDTPMTRAETCRQARPARQDAQERARGEM